MEVLQSLDAVRALRQHNTDPVSRIGFVPTMGALHDGHLSLVRALKDKCDHIWVSIYVNPTQFAPDEDFETYPRDEAYDLKKLKSVGVNAVYLPKTEEIYPPGNKTQIRVEGLSSLLDGRHRPQFFEGVTNVVARLFNHIKPDIAAFGEKDFQQLQIIRRMTRDLGLPIDILGVATMREKDGLAMSSRNAYLTDAERAIAPLLVEKLIWVKEHLKYGHDISTICDQATNQLIQAGFDKVDYVTAVDSESLCHPAKPIQMDATRILGAAWLGRTRLIDNV